MHQSGCWTATIWQVSNTGEPPATLLWAKALRHCHKGGLKREIWVEPLHDCSQQWKASVHFYVAPLCCSSFLLSSSLFFLSNFFPVCCSASVSIDASSRCAFHKTLHCPLLSFSKSQQLVSCLWHQGPDWAAACSQGAGYCLTIWARSPVSLGTGQAERDHLARVALC